MLARNAPDGAKKAPLFGTTMTVGAGAMAATVLGAAAPDALGRSRVWCVNGLGRRRSGG